MLKSHQLLTKYSTHPHATFSYFGTQCHKDTNTPDHQSIDKLDYTYFRNGEEIILFVNQTDKQTDKQIDTKTHTDRHRDRESLSDISEPD